MEPQLQQVWYITGCTSGTGLALTLKLLNLPNVKVAGTTRDINKLNKLEFSKNENFLGLQVDIVDPKSCQESIDATIKQFGKLTHIVNNAGSCVLGAVEEVSDQESRKMFDALYFGPVNVIRAVLPYFRSQKDGYIFNISSAAGFRSNLKFGHYSGAKFAISGMTEALALDVKPFNIKVSNVFLGLFKTGFLIEKIDKPIEEYQSVSYLENFKDNLSKMPSGDPNKFADILIDYSVSGSELPVNIFVGPPSSFLAFETKLQQLNQQISSQKERNINVILDQTN